MWNEELSLTSDGTLVTVNKRLAAELRRRYDESQSSRGLAAWPSPDVLPWNAWLQRAYALLVDRGYCRLDLLNRHQELALWEEVIEASDTILLRPGAAAELASEAFALCCSWSLDIETLDLSRLDTRLFVRWARDFSARLVRGGYLVQAQLPGALRDAVAERRLPLPQTLLSAGMDTPSPAERALLDEISRQGARVDVLPRGGHDASIRRVAARDREHELELAAQWASLTLTERPGARLAIISASLGTQRNDILRVLTQSLAPNLYLFHHARPQPFDLSLGVPLTECPISEHALSALRLLSGTPALNEFGKLLRSPFIGGQLLEGERRAQLDAALRADGLPRFRLDRLISRLQRIDAADPTACPDLLERLVDAQAIQPRRNERLPAAAMADNLRAQLKALGWPGDQGLDSAEYQQYQRFLDLFDELAALAKVRHGLTRHEALQQLSRIAARTIFQPQSTSTALRVLGPLESVGLHFDGVWLLGVDERQWPMPPRPNPLLPAGLQRELQMPHASADRELAFVSEVLDQLRSSASQLIASYPMTADGQRLDPSPLITDWPVVESPGLDGNAGTTLFDATVAPATLLRMPAPRADRSPTRARGGAALLAAQASCPFAAVTRYRLQAGALPEATTAPDAALLGTLVHRVLQGVWQRLEGSAGLTRCDRSELSALISPVAEAVLDEAKRRRPDLFTPRFRALEKERLITLMLDWLDVERQRRQAFDVLALERDQSIQVSGIELLTRADRIDRLDDGSLVIIDYKTGREVSDAGWFEERLTEPQLPVYALAAGPPVAATLLARVRNDAGGCRFTGVTRAPEFGAGVPDLAVRMEGLEWDALQTQWQRRIGALAGEFAAGRADPTPSAEACRYCDFGAFCRVADPESGAEDA